MKQEEIQSLITPAGELVLKEKRIRFIGRDILSEIGERILHLDLRDNEIQHLEHSALGCLSHLRSLDLRNNRLETLPETLCQLSHLKILKLDHNALSAIPVELFSLPLILLSISDNALFALPEQISRLKDLALLSVAENQIRSLPDSLGSLYSLKVLHLHSNEFTGLPTTICGLIRLEELSLEWFRYLSPSTTRVIKGHIGAPIIASLREICGQMRRSEEGTISLGCFLAHFSEAGFDINRVDARFRSLLHFAASSGDLGVLRGLVENHCDLNLIDIDGHTPLVIALREDNVAAAKLLVQAGARLDVGGGSFGSALNLAVIKSEPWLVSAILRAGGDVNLKDSDGNTCLHHLMAVYKKHKHRNSLIADLVVDAGVEVNALNNEKWAALHIAARKGQTAGIRWICCKNEEIRRIKGETFDLNIVGGTHAWTPLHMAAHSGQFKTVEALVAAGVDTYVRSNEGKTPKDTSKGDLALYKFLCRVEKEHLKLSTKIDRDIEDIRGGFKDGLVAKYRDIYGLYRMKNTVELERIAKGEENSAVKADAAYLVERLRMKNFARSLMTPLDSEDSLGRTELFKTVDLMRDGQEKRNNKTLIGPKLQRAESFLSIQIS
jgi:ankyrin repeat protein